MPHSNSNESSKGLIIVVDDEPFIAKYIALVLRRDGYDVMTALSAAEAWELFQQGGRRARALVTDIVMPGDWDGLELTRRVHAVAPGLPVLLVTGYPPSDAPDPCCTLLPKPFTAEALQRAIRQALEPSAGLAVAGGSYRTC